MPELGFMDGRYINLDELVVPVEDRGHQFGDGIYEVTVSYEGKLFMLDKHIDRMFRSAELLRIQIPYTKEEIKKIHEDLLKKSGFEYAKIYVQVTRGIAPRTHKIPEKITPRLSMTIRPYKRPDQNLKDNGTKALIVPDERWLKCNIKSLNLLGNILAKQTAFENGCFEAILNRDGYITEGSSTNVFAIKEGIIYTAPTNNKILAGITRGVVFDLIKDLNYEVKEEAFTPEFLKAADEVFLTGTTTEVMPIVIIDNENIKDGLVGKMTKEIHKAYEDKIKRDCFK